MKEIKNKLQLNIIVNEQLNISRFPKDAIKLLASVILDSELQIFNENGYKAYTCLETRI